MDQTKWITYTEAVDRYPWSRRTLSRMVNAGEISTLKLHRLRPSVLLSVDDLDKALEPAQ